MSGPTPITITPPGGGATPSQPAAGYSCAVSITAKDIAAGTQEFPPFDAPFRAAAHGGQGYPFEFQKHKVTVISDSRWLGINWVRNGAAVAQTVTVRADDNQSTQVMITYNPFDNEEQVSLTCERKPVAPTTPSPLPN